ncbi:PHP domain-containing protein [Neptuniibacter halophilus]|uniref:PHP domain-containing protein n=1 Tax=Neptuniibacter halophilus TaxID=651666 RepID=UPI0033063E52
MCMDLPRYDLHCHSTASDGSLSPADLLNRARSRGIEVLSLTDHDTLEGVRELMRQDLEGIQLVPGTELTCLWQGRVIHLVGLGLDPENNDLQAYLNNLALLRRQRSEKIARQLEKMGVPPVYAEAQALAGKGSIGRPHFARALVEKGFVVNEQQAFKKYLGAGKKGDVKMPWPDLADAVSVLKAAGGVSIIAHPTKYKMTFTKIRSLVADFIAAGGDGIEVSYPGVTPDHQLHLNRIAESNNLLVSAGSDFHTPDAGWTDLGKYPPLKTTKNHVLRLLIN